MTLSFRINADSEAVFTAATLRTLREMSPVFALDYLMDIQHEASKLYAEIGEAFLK